MVKLGNVEYTVTISNNTSVHPYHGSGSSVGYFINGKESPILTFTPGKTYKFLVFMLRNLPQSVLTLLGKILAPGRYD